MTPLRVRRGGMQLRVADPAWDDPLDPSHARERGGRWNPPGSFPTLYLNATLRVARANVDRLFHGLPYGPEDIDPAAAPVLVEARVPSTDVADLVSDSGCDAVGLPVSYPMDADGQPIGHERCQPIGQALHDAGEAGLAVRSAAPGMTVTDEELAWFRFERDVPRLVRVLPFEEWYPPVPGPDD